MRRLPKEQRRNAGQRASTYSTSLVATAALAGFLTLLCMVALNELRLARIVNALASQAYTWDERDAPLFLSVVVLPIIIALVASGTTAAAIRVLRVSLYARRAHRHAEMYLRRYAPLHCAGIDVLVAPMDADGRTHLARIGRLRDALNVGRRLRLVGEAGAGKTVALYALLHQATRTTAIPALSFGKRPLPVLLRFAADGDSGAPGTYGSLQSAIHERLSAMGTAGLAARLPTITRRQGLLVLCDQLELLPETSKISVGDDLLALTEHSTKNRVVVTYTTSAYAAEHSAPGWPHLFQTVALNALSEAEVRRVLSRLRTSRAAQRPRKDELCAALARFRLGTTVQLPVGLVALMTVWQNDNTLPYGRGALYLQALTQTMQEPATREGTLATQQSLSTLGAIATAMRRSGAHTIPMQPNMPVGTAAALWLAEHDPLQSAQAAGQPKLMLNASETDEICRRAMERGILAQSHPGAPIAFANSVIEGVCAAWWLHDTDDGLSRLSPELLRPEWTMPVLLWAESSDAPADLALRLLRLADTPEASAARAGLPTKETVSAAAVSLALAAACEGIAARLARSGAQIDASPPLLTAVEQHLRDLLDAALAPDPDGNLSTLLSAALQDLATTTCPELCANIGSLAQDARLSRLVRAQLVTLLGVLGSPEAVDLLVGFLIEAEPLIRQALPRAMRLAGQPALDALSAALRHPDKHTRERAAEALAGLGDAAAAPALAALQGKTPGERAAAAKALRELRPLQAEGPLIVRLDDGALDVRVAAALALGAIGTADSVAALSAHANAPEPDMRAAVAQALGQIRAPESLTVLEGLLDDAEAEVRAAAATALGLLGDDRALSVLWTHRVDADPVTQNAVTTALRRLGGQ